MGDNAGSTVAILARAALPAWATERVDLMSGVAPMERALRAGLLDIAERFGDFVEAVHALSRSAALDSKWPASSGSYFICRRSVPPSDASKRQFSGQSAHS